MRSRGAGRIAFLGFGFFLVGFSGFDGGGGHVYSTIVQQDFRIDTASVLTIGDDPKDPLHRVIAAVLVGDTLIIAQSSSLRFYDRHSGKFLQQVGRHGEGPGEHWAIASAQRMGDELYTYDYVSQRVTVRTLSGMLRRTVNVGNWGKYQRLEWIGVFPDGSFLFTAEFDDYANPVKSPRLRRNVNVLGRYDGSGGLLDSLGYYLGPEIYVAPYEDGGQLHRVPPPFSRTSSTGVLGTGYYILDNKDATIPIFDMVGVQIGAIGPKSPPEPERISRRDRKRITGYSGIDTKNLPQVYPFYSQSTVVGETLWVLNYVDPAYSPPMKWTVYSHEGELLRWVTAEERLSILAVDGDVAVVVNYGRWDVETVELRRIVETK